MTILDRFVTFGYIEEYELLTSSNHKSIKIILARHNDQFVIDPIYVFDRHDSARWYVKNWELECDPFTDLKVQYLLSTSLGILTASEALNARCGGIVLLSVTSHFKTR